MPNHLKAALLCCGTDELRPTMHHPFHQEGWNMATDAHLIFGWQGEPVTTGHENAPKALKYILDDAHKLEAPFVLHLTALNAALDSVPKVPAKCPGCNGTGNCTCPECEDKHKCGYCKGSCYDPDGKATEPDENALVKLEGLAQFTAMKLVKVQAVMRTMELATITLSHGAANRPALAILPDGSRLLFMPNMVGDDDEVKATITNGQQ